MRPMTDAIAASPSPGLFEQIADRYGISLKGVPVVGDALRDLQAGVAMGCEPHLVLTGKSLGYRGSRLPDSFPAHTRVHADLAEFAEFLLAREAQMLP
jgi:D-glycero-D-manno-heptose 1,7-bisphosphate phosphatase